MGRRDFPIFETETTRDLNRWRLENDSSNMQAYVEDYLVEVVGFTEDEAGGDIFSRGSVADYRQGQSVSRSKTDETHRGKRSECYRSF